MRYYLVHMVQKLPTPELLALHPTVKDVCTPAHFGGRDMPSDPELENVKWLCRRYGVLPVALITAEVNEDQAAYLDSLDDVLTFPVDLDAPISLKNVGQTRAKLESLNFPGFHITESMTWNELLTDILIEIDFMQACEGALGDKRTDAGIFLDRKRGEMQPEWKTALREIYDARGYRTRTLANGSSLREILLDVAQQETVRRKQRSLT